MASIYLDSGDTFTLSGAASVFGSTGTEKLIINSGATGVVVDQNVERVDLAGASSAYTFQAAGNSLKVYSGTTLVATIPVQPDADGTQVVFSNGSANAVINATTGAITLGGAAVTSTAAAVTPTTIDATVTSGAGTSTGTTTGQAFTLTTDSNSLSLSTGNDTVDGSTSNSLNKDDAIVDSLKTDTDTLNATISSYDAARTSTIANVEAVNLTGTFTTVGLDLTNVTGIKTLTANTGISGGTATFDKVAATKVAAVSVGSNVRELVLTTLATTGTAGEVVITGSSVTTADVNGNTGSDTLTATFANNAAVDFTGAAAGTDTYKLNLTGGIKNTLTVGDANLESLTINSTGSAANTLAIAAGSNIATAGVVTGSAALTISGDPDDLTSEKFSKSSYTGSLTLSLDGASGGAIDVSKIVADTVLLTGTVLGGNTFTSNVNSVLKVTNNAAAASFATSDADGTATSSLKAVLEATQTNFITSGVKTLELDVSKSNIQITTALNTSNAGEAIVLTGGKNLEIVTWTNKANEALSASSYTGALTIGNIAQDATVIGGSGNDSITVTTASKKVVAQLGAGNDIFVGSSTAANDTVDGGTGNDTLTGSTGVDQLTGGDGSDVFVLSGVIAVANRDVITDFSSGNDKIAIATAQTTVATAAGNNAVFDEVSTSLVSGAASFVLGTGASGKTSTTADVIEITTALSAFGDLSKDTTNGTELLKALSSTSTAASDIGLATASDDLYIVAYQGGKAYTYLVADTTDTAAVATELQLVGVLNNVAAGGLSSGDFIINS